MLNNKQFLWFISPWLIGLVFLTIGPMIFSLYLSFTKWDMLSPIEWVGIENYQDIFLKPEFYASLSATFIWISFLPLGIVIALFLANFLNQQIRFKNLFRTFIYLPVIVPAVVVNMLWLWLFNPNYGMLNIILESLGFDKTNWLLSEQTVMGSLIIMSLWQVGGSVIIFLAALQGVSKSLLEAAEMDGAGSLRKYFSITLPMISPIILFQLIMGAIGGLQVFSPAQLMTAGGPNLKTFFFVYYIYREAFVNYNMGLAASLSWILFFIISVFVAIIFFFTKRKVYYAT
jgi:multiple sugar transport system permease protein